MSNHAHFTTLLFFASFVAACQLNPYSTPTPPPGWRSPVYQLLVEDSAFPEGWNVLFPQDTSTDPTANYVGRRWGNTEQANSSDKAEQAIWRAYTVSEAETKYQELLQGQFNPSPPVEPDAIFVEFKPPVEISFQSQIADKFYFACGWVYRPYCEVVARYRNYVVDTRMDLQAEYNGVRSDGLTFKEIETILMAIDAKFSDNLDSLPTHRLNKTN